MDYAKHYSNLIARARDRSLKGYRERHHVIPRCMGGCDNRENIVELTAEEHYVAHQLLVKIYPGIYGLAFAAIAMSRKVSGNKLYGWLKRRFSEAPRSLEHRAKIGKASLGNKSFLGRKHSPETRAKMVLSRSKQIMAPFTPEHRAKIGAAFRGRKRAPRSPQACANISAAKKGKKIGPQSPEHIAKRVASTAATKLARRILV